MPGRKYTAGGYRYGYHGQEREDELGAEYYSFEFRVNDTRIGRFLSVDPIAQNFPWNSPYSFAENSVIRYIELEGKEKAEPVMFELAKELIKSWRNDIATTGNNSTLVTNLTRTDVLNQLEAMMNLVHTQTNISSCNSTGYFCGPLAALGATALNNPMAYASIVYDLVTTGKANGTGKRKKTIELPSWVMSADMAGGVFNGQQAIDMIMMYSLRDSENEFFLKKKNLIDNNHGLAPATFPWEMGDLLRRLGLDVQSQKFYSPDIGSLKRLEKAVKNGYTPIIFDNEIITNGNRASGLKTFEKGPGKIDIDAGIHYIVLLDFKRDKANKTVTYTILEGGNITTRTNVSYKDFKKGMKGFWIPQRR